MVWLLVDRPEDFLERLLKAPSVLGESVEVKERNEEEPDEVVW